VWKRHRRFSADGTWDRIYARLLVQADTAGKLVWDVSIVYTINQAHQHATNLSRAPGDLSSYTNLRLEPVDHALGRSQGGLSTKIHSLTDGKGRRLVMLVGPGQGGNSPMFAHLLSALSVPRAGSGRPRTPARSGTGQQGVLFAGEPATASQPPHHRRHP